MPKPPHISGLARSSEARTVDSYIVASHYYLVQAHDIGMTKSVEAVCCETEEMALAVAKKLADISPGEEFFIFKKQTLVTKADYNIIDLT